MGANGAQPVNGAIESEALAAAAGDAPVRVPAGEAAVAILETNEPSGGVAPLTAENLLPFTAVVSSAKLGPEGDEDQERGRNVAATVLRDMSVSPISAPGVGRKKKRKKHQPKP